jgi:hypothetical protein
MILSRHGRSFADHHPANDGDSRLADLEAANREEERSLVGG